MPPAIQAESLNRRFETPNSRTRSRIVPAPLPAGEDTHPPDLILTAFRRHFGDQLERHAARHIPPTVSPP
jgi:hypothetical protein